MGDQLAISPDEAGKRLSLSRSATYAAIERGEIPALRIGKRLLVPVAALERLVSEAAA